MEFDSVVRRRDGDTIKLLRRFSSIKLDFERERRKTVTKYQQQGLQVNVSTPNLFLDKKEIRRQLRASVERYSVIRVQCLAHVLDVFLNTTRSDRLPELYVKMICALFPQMKSREMPDSNALIQHLKRVFRLTDQEHSRLMDIARMTKLPQRIINLEIVEARNIPAKDPNGLSDPFCVVFVNSRDVAQRTKVVPTTLNPVWKQYFTFKVNDLARDILHVEVMDHNEQDEPLRERIRRFKEIKSPGTLGILLKEIANARSVQELIGSLKIPVSEISSETIEKWFKLKNNEDRGEIYLRMALGYNKSKEAATEEFLQIVHFLLVYELDKDTSLGTPFYWDENYEMWSKYILRQFKWQGGLKPKDIVLAKWRAYTVVNSIFPLNANMMCLLMDAVLERALNFEYDAREVTRFWDCTVGLIDSIMTFITDLHDVLPCPVTVLHTYHMLKTIELLNQFIVQPSSCDRGKVPFTKPAVLQRVTNAVRNGANKFYLKVFSDSTSDQIAADQDPLQLAVERLMKMGQILHEDIRLGVSTVNTDFKGILNIDYLNITYQVYDEQYGKMVKFIVEEYNGHLFDSNDNEADGEDTLDENSPFVKIGLAVLKLFLAVKTLADLAPPNYVDENTSEFSLKGGFHDWFFHSVATWIDILRRRVIKLVKTSVSISESSQSLSPTTDTLLSKIDKQSVKDVPISPSAVDTAQLFLEINKFWTSLGWQNPRQSYVIVRKILEELFSSLVYYATEILTTLTSHQPPIETCHDENAIFGYLRKGSVGINNVNYVKEHVEVLGQQLNISEIIIKIEGGLSDIEEYEESVGTIRSDMQSEIRNIVDKIIRSCVHVTTPRIRQLLMDMSKEEGKYSSTKPSRPIKKILDFVDNCLLTMKENLENQNFRQFLNNFWQTTVDGVNERVKLGQETGWTSDQFQRFRDLMIQLHSLFWPRDSRELNLETHIENSSIFDNYDDLKEKLSFMGAPLEELKMQYYEQRYQRQKSTSSSTNEHGIITIRAGFVETESSLVVEILNARKLKSYDSNNLSDPYATATFVPKEYFHLAPVFTTKCHKETLYPLFEETFAFTVTTEDRNKGYLMVTLYDSNFISRDQLMGEVFLSLADVITLSNPSDVDSLPQLHLCLCKPDKKDLEFLHRFEERVWDKEAAKFAKMEKDRMQ